MAGLVNKEHVRDRIYWKSIVGLMILTFSAAATRAGDPDPQGGRLTDERRLAIRTALRQSWDALGSIELTCEEYYADAAGEPDKSKWKRIYDLTLANEGQAGQAVLKSVLRIREVGPDGETSVFNEVRRDGKNTYTIVPEGGKPDTQGFIHIKQQNNALDEYDGMTFSVLWLLMPAKRPLYKLLDEGNEVAEAGLGNRTQGVTIRSSWNNVKIKVQLDPMHGWLPARIELGGSRNLSHYTVGEFKKANGSWYPASGRFMVATEDRQLKEKAFKVTAIKFNSPTVPGRFSMPAVKDGVPVQDEVAGRSYVKGLTAKRKKRGILDRVERASATPRQGLEQDWDKKPVPFDARRPGFAADWAVLVGILGASGLVVIAAYRVRTLLRRRTG